MNRPTRTLKGDRKSWITPDSLAAGVPCRVIRGITDADRLENHPEFFADPRDMDLLPDE
ncbi:MAG: hypothetical protein IJU75_07085 [Clostridia bacterium]|nr:hypothetical protein [Clostridia bacterium]